MYSDRDAFDVLGPQRVADLLRPKIVDELLTPRGLRPELVPVVVTNSLTPLTMGQTDWDGPDQRPYRIRIANPLSGSMVRTPLDMAGTLAHELVHASLWHNREENDRYAGHGPTFEHYVRAIGLTEGKVWAAYKGPQFAHWYNDSVVPMLVAAIEEAGNARPRDTKLSATYEGRRRSPASSALEALARRTS